MFLGSKFCGHCGVRSVTAVVRADDDAGVCPRCKKKLHLLEIGVASIRECGECGGLWTGVDTFEAICADKEQQSAVLKYVTAQSRDPNLSLPINYVPCPVCSQLMNRSNFARISGVVIDLCKQHGVWFDADELSKIIDFIDKGGLVRSREKEKISLEEERNRLRDEQRKLGMMESRSGVGRFKDSEGERGFGGVIAALFDL